MPHNVEKLKSLLLEVEKELRYFRDGTIEDRMNYRRLDAYDIGYISSLMTMLTEEDKFQRWLALTTLKFHSF